MGQKLLIDLQTKEGIDNALIAVLGDEYKKVIELLQLYLFDGEFEIKEEFNVEFIEQHNELDWKCICNQDLWVKGYHFTTRRSKEDILSQSIYNLPYLVTHDTDLRRFFLKHDIEIDYANCLVSIQGRKYDINEGIFDGDNKM